VLGAVGGGAVLVGGGYVAVELFAPERSTRVDEAPPADGETLKQGPFVGEDGHRVSGTVALVRAAGGHALRFTDYEQEQGPDVFVYLTPDPDPDTTAAVTAGRRVLIDGGADGGESTKGGSFTQPVAGAVDPDDYAGVSVWCDRFAVPFEAATLEPVTPA
jgi:hypothetical protein